MFQTQRFIIACLALFLGVGLGVLISQQIQVSPSHSTIVVEPIPFDASVAEFKNSLEVFLSVKHHRSFDETTPATLMAVFPGLVSEDFNGVETTLGKYEYTDGVLVYSNTEVVDGAADVITDAGMKTFKDNVYWRLQFSEEMNMLDVVEELTRQPKDSDAVTDDTATSSEQTICTLDAKVCPDGTAVGRTGPLCEFAACPSEVVEKKVTACTPEQKGAEACIELYAPVCASVQIQCVTTPCEPIPKTFSNSCFACAEQSVDAYTEGACATEE